MPRFEYDITIHIKKRGKIQIDAPTEEEAYEKLTNNLDSYEEDIYDFPTDEIEVSVSDYKILEEE